MVTAEILLCTHEVQSKCLYSTGLKIHKALENAIIDPETCKVDVLAYLLILGSVS